MIPWLKGRRADAKRPGEEWVRCLECEATGPFAKLQDVGRYIRRGEELAAVTTGKLVSCQKCGEVFVIDADGNFKRHHNALPMTPQRPTGKSRDAEEPTPPGDRREPTRMREKPRT